MLNWFKKKPDPAVAAAVYEMPEPTADQIVFRIKNRSMIDMLKSIDTPEESMPAGWPLAGDLIVTFAFDSPGLFRMVSFEDTKRLGLDAGALYKIAMGHLQSGFSQISIADLGSISRLESGGDMEACMLLVPGLWEDMQKRVKGKLVMAVPHRSTVLFTGSEHDEDVRTMHIVAVEINESSEDNHSLSKNLFTPKDDSWEVYRTYEEAFPPA